MLSLLVKTVQDGLLEPKTTNVQQSWIREMWLNHVIVKSVPQTLSSQLSQQCFGNA